MARFSSARRCRRCQGAMRRHRRADTVAAISSGMARTRPTMARRSTYSSRCCRSRRLGIGVPCASCPRIGDRKARCHSVQRLRMRSAEACRREGCMPSRMTSCRSAGKAPSRCNPAPRARCSGRNPADQRAVEEIHGHRARQDVAGALRFICGERRFCRRDRVRRPWRCRRHRPARRHRESRGSGLGRRWAEGRGRLRRRAPRVCGRGDRRSCRTAGRRSVARSRRSYRAGLEAVAPARRRRDRGADPSGARPPPGARPRRGSTHAPDMRHGGQRPGRRDGTRSKYRHAARECLNFVASALCG